MKEILEILMENLTLSKALRLKKSSEEMDSRFIRGTFIPSVLAIGFVMLIMFAIVVICAYYDPESFTGGEGFEDKVAETGLMLIFLMIGFIFGLMVLEGSIEGLIKRSVKPYIDDAMERLAEGEDESECSKDP